MNFSDMMQVMSAWNTFKSNHPKFPAFCKAIGKKGIREESIIEITVTLPDGEKIATNLKVQASDLELIHTLTNLKMNG